VAIVTGHNADGTEARMDWNALARIDTLVFLMGVHNVGKITDKLMAAGRRADTPAAIIQMAFWPGERTITGTLGTIAEECRQAGIEPPATLVIGEVVRLRERITDGKRDLDRARQSVADMMAAQAAAD
jgi:siroheme synthase